MLQGAHENKPKGKLTSATRSLTHFKIRLACTTLGANWVCLVDFPRFPENEFEQASKNRP